MSTTPLLEAIAVLVLFGALGISCRLSVASPLNHRYNVGDLIPLFVNKVGPLSNPSETYQYYELPFCRPDPLVQKKATLGEALNGDRLTGALHVMRFREDKHLVTLCEKKLNGAEVSLFRDAIRNDFYFQMYCDDLPVWGFVGKVDEQSWILDKQGPKYYLFTHIQFDASFNRNQIVEVNAFSDPNHVIDITDDVELDVRFTYSIFWNETSAEYGNRMNKYSWASLLPISQKIHWFSFLNSVAIIILLMGLLTLLFMRRLKNDLRKSSGGDGEDEREVVWKYLHGDVFRCPPNLPLFSAVLGVGTQLLIMLCSLFLLSSLRILYPYNRGTLFTSIILIYSLTSVVSGYTSASFYCQFNENGWEKSVILSGILYLGPSLVIVSILNIVAISNGTTAALPFGTIRVLFMIYTFISLPLLAFGGIIGYRLRSEFQAPCATKRIVRDIPPLAWFRKLPCQMFISGLLSFSAVVLELHHLYASMWGFKIFTLPSTLFITFIILIILTAILSVGLTYIQLSVEDHQWWWRSVFSGGSTAIFMFGYCIYFYARLNMNGFLQLCFFVGYNACICYAFFLMLGVVSFRVALIFVRRIYDAVKSE
ncbi:transmembrane 9 superfamily member 5-like isoform X1 [Cucurbita moschata]|uniref:Transmembrane 9 superfamily member n=1 Tax=Cucurbita moschata TaxID=3662 RepID=A0A6J1FZ26_CUCMO|nr:transmembrane 9 superfamily member 5-like isoform X1 [Cucurbita moschata]